MTHYAFSFDGTRCTGCKTCEMACKDYKDLDLGVAYRKVYEVTSGETVRDANGCFTSTCTSYPLSLSCNHCDDPACTKVCPTGASYVADDGTVQIDAEKCIGCKYCLAACPYQARYATESGEAGKCSFCHHRTTEGMLPACVGTCVTSARYFGDLNDPDSDISKEIVATNAQPIAGDLTKSKVIYVR